MIKITRFFYVHILVIPLLFVAFVTKSQMTFFLSYGIVFIHELCHLLAAVCLGVKVYSLIVLPFGMTVRLDPAVVRAPKKEAAIAAAGPLSNAILLLLGGLLPDPAPSMNKYLFLIINGAMLLLNLLPIPPLDGGRILRAVVVRNVGLMPAAKVVRRISFIFIGLICVSGIFLLLFFHGNPSLIMIGAFLLFGLINEQKNSELLMMRELLYNKETQRKDGLIPTKLLCIRASTPAKQILKKLNLSTFYIIAIIDDEMRIMKTVTERDFIHAVMTNGYGICAGDVLMLKQ